MKNQILAMLMIALLAFTSFASVGGVIPPAHNDSETTFLFDEQTGTLATLGADGRTNANVIVTGYSEAKRVYTFDKVALTTSVTVTTPAAKTFTCVAATDLCTAASSGFLTGVKGQGTTTTTLPAGLSTSTDYFVIFVTTTTFKLATSYANSILGTAIDITDTGTGTHTFTPTALAGGAASLQGSVDGSAWADIGSTSQNITATGVLIFSITDTYYPFVRMKFVNTAGVYTVTTRFAAKSRTGT
ncbi:MAG: hypothetical protein ABL984_08715 [Pyrinomonadaceae bacterium]